MITVDDVIALFISIDTQIAMGECAYQRLVYTLGVLLPCMYILFGMVLCVMLAYSLFKLVVGK